MLKNEFFAYLFIMFYSTLYAETNNIIYSLDIKLGIYLVTISKVYMGCFGYFLIIVLVI